MCDEPAIRVALVNDHEILTHGLKGMLAPYGDLIKVEPFVPQSDVLLDIALVDPFAHRDPAPAEVARLSRHRRIRRVVMYSWRHEPEAIRLSATMGAEGFLAKHLSGSDLSRAIVAIHHGDRLIVPVMPGLEAPVPRQWPGGGDGLSTREAETLALIVRGLSNRQIAQQLYVSENSVKSYIRGAYRKIGVSRRSQAVRWGYEHGLGPGLDQAGPHPKG